MYSYMVRPFYSFGPSTLRDESGLSRKLKKRTSHFLADRPSSLIRLEYAFWWLAEVMVQK